MRADATNGDACRQETDCHHREDRLLDGSGLRAPSSDDEAENQEEQNEEKRKPDGAKHGWILRCHDPNFFVWALDALIIYARAAADRTGEPVAVVCSRLAARHGVELTAAS